MLDKNLKGKIPLSMDLLTNGQHKYTIRLTGGQQNYQVHTP